MQALKAKTLLIRNVPEELHKEFRHYCVDNDISMNQALIEMIRETIEKAKKRRS